MNTMFGCTGAEMRSLTLHCFWHHAVTDMDHVTRTGQEQIGVKRFDLKGGEAIVWFYHNGLTV